MSGVRTLVASLLLVASIAPVVFVALPMARDEHQNFADRYLDRDPQPAPDVTAPGGLGGLPRYRGVPVLAYHGIDAPGPYSISQTAFARQTAMLHRAGAHAISVDEYVRFLHGERGALPPRPVLITFDDGLVSSYRGADAVLERYGMRAVMYTIAGEAEDGSEYYLSPDELEAMAASGRWDIQLHAGEGHYEIPYDAAGDKGPFYAYREYADGRLESFAQYRRRVTEDVLGGAGKLGDEVAGFDTDTFAFPFGAVGTDATNDPRIPRFLVHWFGRHFEAMFEQADDPRFTEPGPLPRLLERFEVRRDTSLGELRDWLLRGARA